VTNDGEVLAILRALGALGLRAGHHFDEAAAFVPIALYAAMKLGFDAYPQNGGFRLSYEGQRYVVKHRIRSGEMFVSVRGFRERGTVIETINISKMYRALKNVRRVGEYVQVVRPIWKVLFALRRDALERLAA
jgi:hypothetical protein